MLREEKVARKLRISSRNIFFPRLISSFKVKHFDKSFYVQITETREQFFNRIFFRYFEFISAMSDINFLRNLPQFQAMRRQLQQHPEMLPQLLQEIGRDNPQLLTVSLTRETPIF